MRFCLDITWLLKIGDKMNRKLLIRLVAFVVAFLFFPIQFVVVRAERYEVKPSFLGDLYSDEISSYIASGKLKVEATTIAVKISELDGVLVEQLNVEYLFARSATSLEISACVVGENVKLFENDKELNYQKLYMPVADLSHSINMKVDKSFDFFGSSNLVPTNEFTFTTSTFSNIQLKVVYTQPRNNFYSEWTGANGKLVREGNFRFWVNPQLNRRVDFKLVFPAKLKFATFGVVSSQSNQGLSSKFIEFSTDGVPPRGELVIFNVVQFLEK